MYSVTLKSGNYTHSTISNVPQEKLGDTYDQVVLFLHGFPDDNSSFTELMPLVLDNLAGKTLALAPLMRGYETSSQHPDIRNSYRLADLAVDIRNFVRQNLSPSTKRVHLVGHDWGALGCFKAASMYPGMFASVSTLAIPYLLNLHAWEVLWYVPEQIYLSLYFLTMQLGWFYDKLKHQHSENSYLNSLWEYWLPGWDYSHEAIEHVRKTLQKPGVVDHVTAYYRCLFNPFHLLQLKAKIDFEKSPTLLLGGKTDGCMSRKLYELEKKKLEHEEVKVEVIDAGHFLHRERPRKVAEIVSDWINDHNE